MANVPTPEAPSATAVAFIAEMIRLQRNVREIGRQLDRVEVEMHKAFNEIDRLRFQEHSS